MSLGLDASASGPGACEKFIIMSGFQLNNSTNLQLLRVPVNPHPPVAGASLRGSQVSAQTESNTSVVCNLGGDFAGQNSGLNSAPGGYDHVHNKLVISTTRSADGVGCWLSVDVDTCESVCIPQIQYIDSSPAMPQLAASDDGPRDRKYLDTIAFYEPAGVFVGIGRYLFANGTVGVVPGMLNAEAAQLSIPLHTAPEFATWDSSWEGTIAVDGAADRMYWLGYTNEAMGNELVFTSARGIIQAASADGAGASAAPVAGTVPSTSLGKLCGTHTDDMVAVGCPFSLAMGRVSYWAAAAAPE